MSIDVEYRQVLRLPNDKLKQYLKDDEFRKRLFSSEGHYLFVWLVQDLKDEQLLFLLDDNLIPLLKNDSRLGDKLNAIMTCGNPNNNEFLKKKDIIEIIINKIKELYYFLENLNVDFGISFFKYLVEVGKINYIEYLNKDVQLEILKKKENLEIIKNQKVEYTILGSLSKSPIEYLLNDSYFENVFLNSPINFIANIIKRGVKLPTKFHYSNVLIEKYLQIEDPMIFIEYLIDLGEENFYLKDVIKAKREKINVQKVESIDTELGIFKEYVKYLNPDDKKTLELDHLYEKRLNKFQLSTSYKLLDIIIGMNYEDVPYNFFKNLQNIINYVENNDISVIPIDRLNMYKKILNFENLSIEDKISLFYELNNKKNALAEFYDDYKVCYNDSLIKMKNNCLKVENLKKSLLSDKYNLNIYELNGEKFKMLINHTYVDRNNKSLSTIWGYNQKIASLSLIGDKCLQTFRDPKNYIILGFNDFDYQNVMHIYHSDSMSLCEFSSNRVIDLLNPNDLIAQTVNYNEILMKYSNKLKPSYVVCYDNIKDGDIDASRKLGNIPIVLIHTDKYEQQISKIDFLESNYISYSDYRMKQSIRRGR